MCVSSPPKVLDELRRILDNNNSNYVEELRERWLEFKSRVSFYGVYKKAMKPPMSLSAGKDSQHNTKIICIFMFVSVY